MSQRYLDRASELARLTQGLTPEEKDRRIAGFQRQEAASKLRRPGEAARVQQLQQLQRQLLADEGVRSPKELSQAAQKQLGKLALRTDSFGETVSGDQFIKFGDSHPQAGSEQFLNEGFAFAKMLSGQDPTTGYKNQAGGSLDFQRGNQAFGPSFLDRVMSSFGQSNTRALQQLLGR